MLRTRTLIALALTGAALFTAAHVTAAAKPAVKPAVTIKDFKFGPPTLMVPVGTVVTWTNRDEEPHTVTSATGAFASAGLSFEDTFKQKFTKPGTYTYFCALHPQMKATVVVR
jgi:plastocyanin